MAKKLSVLTLSPLWQRTELNWCDPQQRVANDCDPLLGNRLASWCISSASCKAAMSHKVWQACGSPQSPEVCPSQGWIYLCGGEELCQCQSAKSAEYASQSARKSARSLPSPPPSPPESAKSASQSARGPGGLSNLAPHGICVEFVRNSGCAASPALWPPAPARRPRRGAAGAAPRPARRGRRRPVLRAADAIATIK